MSVTGLLVSVFRVHAEDPIPSVLKRAGVGMRIRGRSRIVVIRVFTGGYVKFSVATKVSITATGAQPLQLRSHGYASK